MVEASISGTQEAKMERSWVLGDMKHYLNKTKTKEMGMRNGRERKKEKRGEEKEEGRIKVIYHIHLLDTEDEY